MTDPSQGAEDAGPRLWQCCPRLQNNKFNIESDMHGFALTLTTVLLSALPVFVVG
eukprot:CAMPEP_0203946088 /NCGR_PEP_ID=MMETSP0359-20131031/81450_1 /ASSEMBLY_ACC=CAM_ASM_000338 /TAXON_ID=268821 /ORGANISM="Scrippsiella Hangoei, Strain SHTV-5" /LENGTH=54 /DNA_ID=CAMNT_0050877337 /DNA_START=28 /DNA_END=188 /DNA_ORIENTATION=-